MKAGAFVIDKRTPVGNLAGTFNDDACAGGLLIASYLNIPRNVDKSKSANLSSYLASLKVSSYLCDYL